VLQIISMHIAILLSDLKTKHYNAISILYRYSHIQRWSLA